MFEPPPFLRKCWMGPWWSDLHFWCCFSGWPSLHLLTPIKPMEVVLRHPAHTIVSSVFYQSIERYRKMAIILASIEPPWRTSRVPALVSSCQTRWAKGWWEQIQPGMVGVLQSHVEWLGRLGRTWKNLMILPGSVVSRNRGTPKWMIYKGKSH